MLKLICGSLLFLYLAVAAILFLVQRKLLYFPTPAVQHALQLEWLKQGEVNLEVAVLNPGQRRAILYFGGNAEVVSANAELFKASVPQYSVYLSSYRGYGGSDGAPTEQALFADALALYDKVVSRHQSIAVMGRSLGTGVGVYLASERTIDRLMLITPYDSIAAVAQSHYPFFPVRYLITDKYDSLSRASGLELEVEVVLAENDQVIPPKHSEALIAALAHVKVCKIPGSDHNSVSESPDYGRCIQRFFASAAAQRS